ncbi:MAG: hypothetical protein KBB52_03225, partial [Candidatus Omnitrophica bacterium]|nr:hypothetical protein [Candidatus Omnitrophota bacterium]
TVYKMITYSGLITLILLIFGFFIGILDISFYVHKYTGIAILIFAIIHAGLVLYSRIKARRTK